MDSYERLSAAAGLLTARFVQECLVSDKGLVLVFEPENDEASTATAVAIDISPPHHDESGAVTHELNARPLRRGDVDRHRAEHYRLAELSQARLDVSVASSALAQAEKHLKGLERKHERSRKDETPRKG